jgi:hypothetical protein
MPKLVFTPEELKNYFASNEAKFYHCFYERAVEAAHEMLVHADGIYPEKLLCERRPNEPLEVKDYRRTIFIPKTKPYFGKIMSSLNKIRRSADWSINYSGEWSRIPEGEQLKDYCEHDLPGFYSVTNWMFAVWMKKYLTDPNAVIFVFPKEIPGTDALGQAVLLKPMPYVFDSCDVLDYVAEDYAVLKNPEGCFYRTSKGLQEGNSFYIVTTQTITQYDQASGRAGDYEIAAQYVHGLGMLPVYRIGAVIVDNSGDGYFYESRLAGIKPEFDEALREYNDLQAAKVLHMFPERWEFVQTECTSCAGTGKRRNPQWFQGCDAGIPAQVECNADGCSHGYIASGPFSKMLIRPANVGAGELQGIPTPPAGFVEKDIEIIRIQEESVHSHIFNGLAANNFEFLMVTPLNQSGTAKEVDKDELNNGVHAIAEDMVRNMDWIYEIIAKYRYGVQYPSDEDIDAMVPVVSVPEKYDILSAKHLEDQLKAAKDNKVNPVITNALEIEYANKALNNDPEVRDRVELILELDPLANIDEDVKNSRLQNNGITLLTYVISSNIQQLVQQAIEDDPGFMKLDPITKRDKIAALAQGIIDAEAERKAALMVPLDPTLDTPAPVPGQQQPDPNNPQQ